MTDQEKIEICVRALEDIADPIGGMRRNLKPGYRLDGAAAIRLADDAEFYKRRAREALERIAHSAGVNDG